MASTSSEIRIAAPIGRVFDVITDFARYPEFVPGVRACRVLRTVGDARHVEYDVDLAVRQVRYVLAIREERPRRVSWTLVGGELFTRSDGSWDLAPDGEGTRARYAVDVQVTRPMLVPQAIVDRVTDELTRVQLPRMLGAFKARAEGAA